MIWTDCAQFLNMVMLTESEAYDDQILRESMCIKFIEIYMGMADKGISV